MYKTNKPVASGKTFSTCQLKRNVKLPPTLHLHTEQLQSQSVFYP